MRAYTYLLALFCLSGCTTLFFQPSHVEYPYIYLEKLKFQNMTFTSHDGTQLAAWYLPSNENRKLFPDYTHTAVPTRGLVVQFHGNAENMSSHYRGVAWMLFEGYDVLTFDYRGYGRSEGSRSSQGIYEDTLAALEFAAKLAREHHLPLVLYGQSLGGSLLLKALEDQSAPAATQAVVIESAFYSYQQIAREKLKLTWVTWPFQWLAWILISDRYSPGNNDLAKISPIPAILIYSSEDPIVPVHHGEQFMAKLKPPKELWIHPNPGHINSMFVEKGKYREKLLRYLEKVAR